MPLLSIQQSRFAYFADFGVYGVCVAALAAFLGLAAPHAFQWQLVAWALGGLGGWTLIEYGLHRFVLHRLPPFQAMHEPHHQRGHTHHYGVSTSLWDHVFRTT